MQNDNKQDCHKLKVELITLTCCHWPSTVSFQWCNLNHMLVGWISILHEQWALIVVCDFYVFIPSMDWSIHLKYNQFNTVPVQRNYNFIISGFFTNYSVFIGSPIFHRWHHMFVGNTAADPASKLGPGHFYPGWTGLSCLEWTVHLLVFCAYLRLVPSSSFLIFYKQH